MYRIEKPIIRKVCPSCRKEFDPHGTAENCPDDNSLLARVADDPLVGATIADRYEIIDLVGVGGWSMVYRARHKTIGRIAAVKVLHPHLVSNPQKVKRFEHEAKASANLNHRNIANVYDFGILPSGQPYLIMDLISGQSLSEILKTEKTLSVERALDVFIQAGSALAYAHEMGVIHRDFKPANVMLITGPPSSAVPGEGNAGANHAPLQSWSQKTTDDTVPALDDGHAYSLEATAEDMPAFNSGERLVLADEGSEKAVEPEPHPEPHASEGELKAKVTSVEVKILDFGLAKLIAAGEVPDLTKTGDTLGTPPYMSPEQCQGKKLDARSDIYSFGCVMYEALAGRSAVEGTSAFDCMYKHLSEMPPPISDFNKSVPEALESLVIRSLAKAPEDRYQSMADLVEELKAIRPSDLLSESRKRPAVTVVKGAGRKHVPKMAVWAVIVFAGACVLGISVGRRLSGDVMPDNLDQVVQLLTMARQRGDVVGVEKLLRHSFFIAERDFGKESGQMGVANCLMGSHYLEKGDVKEARRYFDRAFVLRSVIPNTPEKIISFKEMADFYLKSGDDAIAEKLYNDALFVSERLLGPGSPTGTPMLYSLGKLKLKQNNDKKALKYLDQYLAIMESTGHARHAEVADAAGIIAQIDERMKKPEEAEEMYRHAIKIQMQLYGKQSSQLKGPMKSLADFLSRQGRKTEAAEIQEKINRLQSK